MTISGWFVLCGSRGAIVDDFRNFCLSNELVPYINNYLPVSLRHEHIFDYVRRILEAYKREQIFAVPHRPDPMSGRHIAVKCPYKNCRMEFNLHVEFQPGDKIRCPQCLGDIEFRGRF